MKILIITQWFNPEPNNMKALVFAKKLRELGNDVQVLTGFPNYPTGEIYEGYNLKLYKKEHMDGIQVHRVWLYPSHDANKWKRMANYFSYGISASIIGSFVIKGKIDVVYVYHPPVTSTIPAFLIGKIKNAKVLLDVNDLWPDSIRATGMMSNNRLLKIINQWCNYTYKMADSVNVLSKGIKNKLVESGVPERKVSTIPVWCNEDIISYEKDSDFIKNHKCDEIFTLMYAGAIGEAQDLDVLVDVAELLRKLEYKIQIILIGSGTCKSRIQHEIEKRGLNNIKVLPQIASEKITAVLNCADILFVHLKKEELFKVTIPSKIPLYMALKKMLIVGLEGDSAQIIQESRGGIVCQPECAEDICAAILKAYNMTVEERNGYANRGYDYYVKKLSLQSGVRAFNDELKRIMEV